MVTVVYNFTFGYNFNFDKTIENEEYNCSFINDNDFFNFGLDNILDNSLDNNICYTIIINIKCTNNESNLFDNIILLNNPINSLEDDILFNNNLVSVINPRYNITFDNKIIIKNITNKSNFNIIKIIQIYIKKSFNNKIKRGENNEYI